MRSLLKLTAGLVVAAAFGAFHGCSCDNTSGNGMDFSVPEMSAQIDFSMGPDLLSCFGGGAPCTMAMQCCSNTCDSTGHCSMIVCGNAGASCTSAADCCGLACTNNVCGGSCTGDNQPCTSGGECCSTICGSNNTCTPLNTTCSTAGNPCTNTTDAGTGNNCCSTLCIGGKCAPTSQVSYCVQVGDICLHDAECCTGVCNIASGTTAGTCAPIDATCSPDGTLCNGCGSCCSRFCGPFNGGPDICQPASGCRVLGDLCQQDSDCCGGDPTAGLPGSGLIKCVRDSTYPDKIGTCGTPMASNCPNGVSTCKMACAPEGDVCHATKTAVCQGGTTNVRNDCCGCVSGKDCCVPDPTGIPRCNALTSCVPSGGICAFSTDCCNGLPCVPDSTGTLRCGSMCIPAGGTCTTNSDCCTGLNCLVPPGSLQGTCGTPTTTNPDMGPVDLAGTTCAQLGQSCVGGVPCCDPVPCLTPSGTTCGPNDTSCSCYVIIP